jgi:tetratricopeptide (TPR) repeat protein
MRQEFETVNEPNTPEELLAVHHILRSDPQRYLWIVNQWIDKNPANFHAYFDRHFAWMRMGEPRRALEDLDTAIGLRDEPDPISFFSRGLVHRHLGEYEKAIKDFNRGEALNPKGWEEDIVFGLLYQADTHARLGNETSALAYCERLPDDFWTPGVYGAPGGGKTDIADKLRSVAADARRERDSNAS